MNLEQSKNVQIHINEEKECSRTSSQIQAIRQTKKSQSGPNSSQKPTQRKSLFYKIQSNLDINKQKAEYLKMYVAHKELELTSQQRNRQITQKQQLLQRIRRRYSFLSKMSQEHAKSRIIQEFKNRLVQDLNYLSNQYRSCPKNTQEQCSAKKQEWQKEAENSNQKATKVLALANLSHRIDKMNQNCKLLQINLENIERKIKNLNRVFELQDYQISATLQKNDCVKEIVTENRQPIELQLTKKQKYVVVGLADIKTMIKKYFRLLGSKNVWGQWKKQTQSSYLEMRDFRRYFVKEQMYQQQSEKQKEKFLRNILFQSCYSRMGCCL